MSAKSRNAALPGSVHHGSATNRKHKKRLSSLVDAVEPAVHLLLGQHLPCVLRQEGAFRHRLHRDKLPLFQSHSFAQTIGDRLGKHSEFKTVDYLNQPYSDTSLQLDNAPSDIRLFLRDFRIPPRNLRDPLRQEDTGKRELKTRLFFEVGSFTLHQISNSSSWLLPRSWGLIEVGNTFLFKYS